MRGLPSVVIAASRMGLPASSAPLTSARTSSGSSRLIDPLSFKRVFEVFARHWEGGKAGLASRLNVVGGKTRAQPLVRAGDRAGALDLRDVRVALRDADSGHRQGEDRLRPHPAGGGLPRPVAGVGALE